MRSVAMRLTSQRCDVMNDVSRGVESIWKAWKMEISVTNLPIEDTAASERRRLEGMTRQLWDPNRL
ncbi:hypothetical protein DY000_02022437 [Brassica cretica]|uniref:NPK1-activating kinesin-like protein C-terminal domain-containing protein n=1 Tax=Brassica cretica TaxID=69181 RepID=A0ABQ7EF53_BRACR|nr:hypothetical protein DY000_02022437 [Brassica cretica]